MNGRILIRGLTILLVLMLVAPAIPASASSACDDRAIADIRGLRDDIIQSRSSTSSMGGICWKLGQQIEENRDIADSFSPHDCIEKNAIPVGDPVVGNGGGAYQFYQNPLRLVYISWVMQTNNINNGADEWFFGVQIDDGSSRNHWEFRQGGCKYVGVADEFGSFDYFVDGGAGAWTSSASCDLTTSWEVNVGIRISATGPEGSGSTTLGGSVSCGSSITLDTESLFHDSGSV